MMALIDGDSIAYMAADLGKSSVIKLRDDYQPGDERKEALTLTELPKAVAYGQQVIDMKMVEILEAVGTTDYRLYVEHWDGKFIFRNALAVTKPYKGNRAGKPKPEILQAMKEYMHTTWNAVLLDTVESEDRVAIDATRYGLDSVICAIDKDMRQVPGIHYDYRKGEVLAVSKDTGDRNLYTQMLTGDSADNIPGCPGIGKVKARRIMEQLDGNYAAEIAKIYRDRNCTYDYLVEQYRLLYLLRNNFEWPIYPIDEETYYRLGVSHAVY